jgi:predicted nuclease with TOPRIM domain
MTEHDDKALTLLTRIDERVAGIQRVQDEFTRKLDEHATSMAQLIQRVGILESKTTNTLSTQVENMVNAMNMMDNRLKCVEGDNSREAKRWDSIFKFAWKIVFIVVAAYILWKLHLQPAP